MKIKTERKESRRDKKGHEIQVTVVERELNENEILRAALRELQEREANRDPNFKPRYDLRKKKSAS